MSRASFLDGAAIGASLLCLIHCVGLPILFALMPAMATLGLPSAEWLHLALLLTAVPMSSIALVGGYRRHGWIVPLALGFCGLVALTAGLAMASIPAAETVFTVAGSLSLASAHLGNWRRVRLSRSL